MLFIDLGHVSAVDMNGVQSESIFKCIDCLTELFLYLSLNRTEIDLVYLFKDALSRIDGAEVFGFSDPNLALEHFQINRQNYREALLLFWIL